MDREEGIVRVRGFKVALGLSTAASLALGVTYAFGGQTQIEGALLLVALGSLGVGLVLFGLRLPGGHAVEDRHPLSSTEEEIAALSADWADSEEKLSRRSFLAWAVGALSALGVALLFPIRSLGPSPELKTTPWTTGARVVDENGEPIHVDTLAVGGVATVFPSGFVGDAAAQTLLIRVQPELLRLPQGATGWAPQGHVAYSKVCTHAGCPVGLYEENRQQLLCPCHQSTFDVLTGANPVFGPATRPLPQLPIGIDDEGYLTALSDYTEPIGPGFWDRGRGT